MVNKLRLILCAFILVGLNNLVLANMTITFKNEAQVKGTTLYGVAAGISGMGNWTPISDKTFTVNKAPGKEIPVNTVVNAMFFKPGYIAAAGNAIIGWDAGSSQFNYGWGDNTPYGTGKLCLHINVDGVDLHEICTNKSTKGVMTNQKVNYTSSSKVIVTFVGEMIKPDPVKAEMTIHLKLQGNQGNN